MPAQHILRQWLLKLLHCRSSGWASLGAVFHPGDGIEAKLTLRLGAGQRAAVVEVFLAGAARARAGASEVVEEAIQFLQ